MRCAGDEHPTETKTYGPFFKVFDRIKNRYMRSTAWEITCERVKRIRTSCIGSLADPNGHMESGYSTC